MTISRENYWLTSSIVYLFSLWKLEGLVAAQRCRGGGFRRRLRRRSMVTALIGRREWVNSTTGCTCTTTHPTFSAITMNVNGSEKNESKLSSASHCVPTFFLSPTFPVFLSFSPTFFQELKNTRHSNYYIKGGL